MKILITGACAVSARSVLRSLKSSDKFRDAEFVGWDMCNLLYGVYEGIFDRIYQVPAVSDARYRDVAEKILKEEKPDAVVVVPEVEVLYWSKNPFPGVAYIVPPPKFSSLVISKNRLFSALAGTGLVPKFAMVSTEEIESENFENPLGYPCWIRDGDAGTASGKGSFKATCLEDLRAWVKINRGIGVFQLSEFLPGGNYGCFCLFKNGRLLKIAQAERIEYIMAKVAVSGITGNTSKGRLLNDERIKRNALAVIEKICGQTGETMNGLVVVDMKANGNGEPIATEINIRHVAFSSSFAAAGFNISEYQVLAALNRDAEISAEQEMTFPQGNLILRDVDGLPIYVKSPIALHLGECVRRDMIYTPPPHSGMR